MATHYSVKSAALAAAVIVGMSALFAGQTLLNSNQLPAEQATQTLLDSMVSNRAGEFRTSVQEYRDATYLLKRMH